MRFAIGLPNVGAYGDPGLLVELGSMAEQSGWDGVFIWDHVAYLAWERSRSSRTSPAPHSLLLWIVGAAPAGRALRHSSERPGRADRTHAPAQKQARVGPEADECFARPAVAELTMPMATTGWPALTATVSVAKRDEARVDQLCSANTAAAIWYESKARAAPAYASRWMKSSTISSLLTPLCSAMRSCPRSGS